MLGVGCWVLGGVLGWLLGFLGWVPWLGSWVLCVGLGVWWGVGCWVGWGVWCLVFGVGCLVLGVGCWVLGVGCWVLGVGCWVLGSWVSWVLGFLGSWVLGFLGVGCFCSVSRPSNHEPSLRYQSSPSSNRHRNHFGSMYKLGWCGNASFFLLSCHPRTFHKT